MSGELISQRLTFASVILCEQKITLGASVPGRTAALVAAVAF